MLRLDLRIIGRPRELNRFSDGFAGLLGVFVDVHRLVFATKRTKLTTKVTKKLSAFKMLPSCSSRPRGPCFSPAPVVPRSVSSVRASARAGAGHPLSRR